MTTFKTEAKIDDDSSIQICGLPFAPGESVEVIVKTLPVKPATSESEAELYPLRGLPYKYYLPFGPADLDDWEKVLETVSPYEREGELELLIPENAERPAGESQG